MSRSRAHSIVLLTAFVAGLAFVEAACSSNSPEQQLLANFFRAARVRDNTTLGNIAAVSFNPRADGIVEEFEVVRVGDEQRRTVPLQQLVADESRAKQEEEAFSRRRAQFQTANQEAISRVARAENARQQVLGPDAEVLSTLTKWREEQAQYSRRLSEVRARLTRERSMAVNSLTRPGQPDADVKGMDVEVVSKQVTVNAQVRTPEGPTVPRTLLFTLQRAVGKRGGETVDGRWIITGLQQQPATTQTS
jgi:hypothetical protein